MKEFGMERNDINQSRAGGWLPLLVLPPLTLLFRSSLPPWTFMWLMAFAIFFGFKWLTWWKTHEAFPPSLKRSLAYLFLWVGMDAAEFLDSKKRPASPTAWSWAEALGKTALGAIFFWGLARLIPESFPLIRGWIGLTGLLFLLHFGGFHLLALVWQSFGVSARPVMNSPFLATSLSDFWGKRWNLAFHELAHTLVFAPVRRAFGKNGAGLAAFFASGLLHELVISLPAGGGYGLPIGYFLLQGFGIQAERSRWGRSLGVTNGFRGWLMTLIFTAGPAFWLFHPPFMTRVMLPFMQVCGAL